MNSYYWAITFVLLLLMGCHAPHPVSAFSIPSCVLASNPQAPSVNSPARDVLDVDESSNLIQQVAFFQDEDQNEVEAKYEASSNGLTLNAPSQSTEFSPGAATYRSANVPQTLPEFERLAIATSPSISQIQSEIEALRGSHLQAGLSPNPTFGISSGDINEDGGGGRHGVYFGRQIVRGNKLAISQSVVCAEIEVAQKRLATVEQQLLTDVRIRYYDLLVAQEKVSIANELVQISRDAVEVSEKLLKAQEVARASLLQAELELQNTLVIKRQAENERLAARRTLAALIGEADLSAIYAAGSVRDRTAPEDFEAAYDRLLQSSPELAALIADVERARRQMAREQVEPIPNATWQTTLQFDTVTDDVVAGFQVGMPIPTRNRNQGAIHRANFEIHAAQQRVQKKALDLRQRLAIAYGKYLDADLQIEAYDKEILPKAKETFDLISIGYQEGEIDFLQLLTAQRTYSQFSMTYLEKLRESWQQSVKIEGMLLSGSLN